MDRWIWSARRARKSARVSDGVSGKRHGEPVIIEYAKAFFPVILIVFLLRSFVVEPFRIPSGSMLPSLLIGDFILVNKFAYGIRLPVVYSKVFDSGGPRRGDVAVFRFPGDPSINYIKRVIGVPSDVVVYKGKRLYINGELVSQTDVSPRSSRNFGDETTGLTRFSERLAPDATHDILVMTERPNHGPTEFSVPPDHYFVMGDNRDQSNDSRYWGYVPEENLVGKAFLIWFSWDTSGHGAWPWERVVWTRIGNKIR